MGLNIAFFPNLIGSSDADFYNDSESGLNSKIKKTPRSDLSIPPLQKCCNTRNFLKKMVTVKKVLNTPGPSNKPQSPSLPGGSSKRI